MLMNTGRDVQVNYLPLLLFCVLARKQLHFCNYVAMRRRLGAAICLGICWHTMPYQDESLPACMVVLCFSAIPALHAFGNHWVNWGEELMQKFLLCSKLASR